MAHTNETAFLNELRFLFKEDDVLYVQQSQIQDHQPKDIGELEESTQLPDPMGLRDMDWIPLRGNNIRASYLGKIMASGAWVGVLQGHVHREEDAFATFSFHSVTYGQRAELLPMLEKATLDMVGWLGATGLIGCTPDEVAFSARFVPTGSESLVLETEDVTEVALPVFSEFAQIAGLLE